MRRLHSRLSALTQFFIKKKISFLPLLRFAAVLPTNDQVPIENIIVAESGDDSEDEWNYIKVDQNTTKSDKATPEPERIEEAEVSKPVLEDSVEDTVTPPTASIGEPDIIASQVVEGNYTDVSIKYRWPIATDAQFIPSYNFGCFFYF